MNAEIEMALFSNGIFSRNWNIFFFCDVDIIIKSSLTGFENKIQKHSGYRRKDSVRIVFET